MKKLALCVILLSVTCNFQQIHQCTAATFNGEDYGDPYSQEPTHAAGSKDSRKYYFPQRSKDSQLPSVSDAAAKKAASLDRKSGQRVPVWVVFLMTTWMALMSGLGAVPYFFTGKLKKSWAGLANAVAVGVMLAASFDLLHEGAAYSPAYTILGMVLGGLFIKFSQEYLSDYEDATFEDLQGADARKAILIIGVMAAHAVGEGSGVGVSFSGARGWAQGTLVTIAIGLHNVPEGMAIATVMMAKGSAPKKALFWTLLCSLPQAIVAVPSYMFVEAFQSLLPLAVGFAAGCMVWIVGAELMPDALESAPHPQVATAVTMSAAWLQGLSMMISTLERPDGKLSSPVTADINSLLTIATFLLPPLFMQLLVVRGAAPALRALPSALGAATAALAGLGATDLIWQLAHGRLAWYSTILWAAIGAGACVFAWKTINPKPVQLDAKQSVDTEMTGGVASTRSKAYGDMNGYHQHGESGLVMQTTGTAVQPYSQDTRAYQRGYNTFRQGIGTIAESPQGLGNANGNTNGIPPSPFDMARHITLQQSYTAVEFIAGQAMPPLEPGSQVPQGKPPTAFYQQRESQYNGKDEAPVGTHMSVQSQFSQLMSGVDYHDLDLHRFLQHSEESDVLMELESFAERGGIKWSRLGKQGRAGLLGAALLVCYAACGVGMHVSRAVAARGKDMAVEGLEVTTIIFQWFIPLALQGLPLGLACLGLGKAIASHVRSIPTYIAVASAVTAVTTVVCCLAGTQLGLPEGNMTGYDKDVWTEKAQCMTAGALLTATAQYLWPPAIATKPKRAQAGAIVGLAVVLLSTAVQAGLCLGTPYCLREQ